MRRTVQVFVVGLLSSALTPARAMEVGDVVIAVKPVEMKTRDGSSVSLRPGTNLTVRAIEGDRFLGASGRIGWLAQDDVIPLSGARESFSKRIEHDPRDAVAFLARGKVWFHESELDRAMADLDESLRLSPESEAYTIRGWAWKRKGDKDRAMSDFNEAIRLNPRTALAWRVRGATWAGKEEYQKAMDHYTESLRIDPTNPDSLHHRALLQAACNHPRYRNGKRAVEDATRACEITNYETPLYLIGLAAAYAEKGDFEEAVRWQTKALDLTPKTQSKFSQTQLELYRERKPFRMSWK